ncbi:MAG: hypothetical protein IPP40_14170, partial [bacterium]|nr:hypothetical protein [bacterium]
MRATVFSKIDFPDSLHGWAVGYDGLIAQTADGGETWETYFLDSVNSTLTSVTFIDSLNGWTIAPPFGGRRIFRYGEPQNSGERQDQFIPAELHIHSASPNPFNNTTEISFEMPRASHALLKVYGCFGRE